MLMILCLFTAFQSQPYTGSHYYVSTAAEFETQFTLIQADPDGGTLHLAPGVYQISGAHVVEKPTRIVGAGAELTQFTTTEQTGSGDGVFVVKAAFHLEACGFDGFDRRLISFEANVAISELNFLDCLVQNQNSLWAVTSNNNKRPATLWNARFIGNRFIDGGYGVRLVADELLDPIFRNNTFENNTGTAILLSDGESRANLNGPGESVTRGALIEHNTIRNINAINDQTYGIYAGGTNHLIRNNYLENLVCTGNIMGIFTKATQTVIADNTLRNVYSTGAQPFTGYGIYIKGTHKDQPNDLLGGPNDNKSPFGNHNLVTGNRVESYQHNGWSVGIGSQNEDMVIENNQVHVLGIGIQTFSVSDAGAAVLTENVTVAHNRVISLDGIGMHFKHAFNHLTLHDNHVAATKIARDFYYAVVVSGGTSEPVSKLTITDNVFSVDSESNAALKVDPVDLADALISGNMLTGPFALRIKALGGGISVLGNTFAAEHQIAILDSNNSLISATQSDILFRGNIGLVTEASGEVTMTSGATSIIVDHGLDVEPDLADITLVPKSNASGVGSIYVSTITPTSFTIHFAQSVGNDVEVTWQVR